MTRPVGQDTDRESISTRAWSGRASLRTRMTSMSLCFTSQANLEQTTGWRMIVRLVIDAPGDTRRVLRRLAEGDLGRLPGMEALGARASRNLERLARAVTFAALVITGSLLLLTPMGGWHHRLGEMMIAGGIAGRLFAATGALRRDRGRR